MAVRTCEGDAEEQTKGFSSGATDEWTLAQVTQTFQMALRPRSSSRPAAWTLSLEFEFDEAAKSAIANLRAGKLGTYEVIDAPSASKVRLTTYAAESQAYADPKRAKAAAAVIAALARETSSIVVE